MDFGESTWQRIQKRFERKTISCHWAIIGAANLSQDFVFAIQLLTCANKDEIKQTSNSNHDRNPHHTCLGTMGRTQDHSHIFADKLQLPRFYTDIQDVCSDKESNAVFIGVNETKFISPLFNSIISSGKHLVFPFPWTMSPEHIKQLHTLAIHRKVRFFVGDLPIYWDNSWARLRDFTLAHNAPVSICFNLSFLKDDVGHIRWRKRSLHEYSMLKVPQKKVSTSWDLGLGILTDDSSSTNLSAEKEQMVERSFIWKLSQIVSFLYPDSACSSCLQRNSLRNIKYKIIMTSNCLGEELKTHGDGDRNQFIITVRINIRMLGGKTAELTELEALEDDEMIIETAGGKITLKRPLGSNPMLSSPQSKQKGHHTLKPSPLEVKENTLEDLKEEDEDRIFRTDLGNTLPPLITYVSKVETNPPTDRLNKHLSKVINLYEAIIRVLEKI